MEIRECAYLRNEIGKTNMLQWRCELLRNGEFATDRFPFLHTIPLITLHSSTTFV